MTETPFRYPDLEPPPAPVPDLPSPEDATAAAAVPPAAAAAGPPPKDKKKDKEFGRGVETMFRTSYRMHVDLAGLADSKANILISINGLIISVILAALAPRIRAEMWLFAPTAVVLCTCLAAITFAVLAARPRVNRPAGRRRDAGGMGENLMFFGGFLALSVDEYEAAVLESIRHPDRLYSGMARDIYALGQVLDRKFRLLRLAYTIFMVGLAVGVLMYLLVFLVMGATEPEVAAAAATSAASMGGFG